jgi:hypothetical protein
LTALIAELWSDPRGDMTREQERFWLLEFMCAFRGTSVIGGLWAAMYRARASRWPDGGVWNDLEPRRDRRPHHNIPGRRERSTATTADTRRFDPRSISPSNARD